MEKRQLAGFVLCLLVLGGMMAVSPSLAQQGEFEIGQTVVVVTTGQSLNLRSGPGTSYSIVARLTNGTRMEVVGGPSPAADYTWWELVGQGVRGWAAGEFLRLASDVQPASTPGVPPFVWPMAAPWPADVTLHAAGNAINPNDGYGYDTAPTHINADKFALDFNGSPTNNIPPIETADQDLLVLSVADGCLKEINYDPGYSCDRNGVRDWCGNYGWNVVISYFSGYEIRYAHLKAEPLLNAMSIPSPVRSAVGCNQFITQGQPIGQIGGTGTLRDQAVHLHFAMYFCDPSVENCAIRPAPPEPMDELTDLGVYKKITSKNYSVGYEEIAGDSLKDPAKLVFHEAIYNTYLQYGGQYGVYGRAKTPVEQLDHSSMYYQTFGTETLMRSTFPATILESAGVGTMLPGAVFDLFRTDTARYGTPTAPTYWSAQSGNEIGWRTDFSNASIIWNWGLENPVVWDATNALWQARFCPGSQQFNCAAATRRDPYIDFSFSDSNNPGPLSNVEGFSGVWQASFDGGLVSRVRLFYRIQGHARFYIDDRPQGEWIHSPDQVVTGSTQPTWHVGGNTFRIEYWQEPGKPARLSLEHESGLVPTVHAFDSQGTLASSIYQPPPPQEFADFEPPPYPEQEIFEDPPDIPGTLPADWSEFIHDLQQRLADWWNGIMDGLRQRIEAWWEQQMETLQRNIEEALIQALDELVQQILQQCCSAPAIPAAAILGVVLIRQRKNLNRKG